VTRDRATLAAVAKEAGVSVPTVSKVVNGRSDVAPDTRARIESLLVRHGYVARGPGGGQPPGRTVAMVFDAMRTPNNVEMLRGALEAASAEDVDVVVDIVPDDPLGAAWARRTAAAHRAGMILVTSAINPQQWRHFAEQHIPVVAIDPVNLPGPDVPSVGATNFNGGMAATGHLAGLGHRRIGFIEGPPEAMMAIARLHGHQAGLAQAGLPADPALMASGAFGFDAGFEAALTAAAASGPVTADSFADILRHLATVHPSRYVRLVEGLAAMGIADVRTLHDQTQALRFVALVDRLYDEQVRVLATGVPLDRVFGDEMLAGGYRKKYLRAISRLIALTS
jgi:LacI family transcriptional regulator